MSHRDGPSIESNRMCQITARLGSLALAAGLSLNSGPVAAQTFCPPMALVLAFDASGSISEQEFFLQTKGTALALMDRSLLDLISTQGGISLSAIIWSDTASGVYTVPWHTIEGEQTMAGFAQKIAAAPRIPSGNTDIGNGLWHALDLLEQVEGCASRRMINISGDGRQTAHAGGRTAISVAAARARAEIEGVVINGLAIANEEAGLAAYFEKNVKVGPGSFVMEIGAFSDFQAAMTRKLFREISEPVVGENGASARQGILLSALSEISARPDGN